MWLKWSLNLSFVHSLCVWLFAILYSFILLWIIIGTTVCRGYLLFIFTVNLEYAFHAAFTYTSCCLIFIIAYCLLCLHSVYPWVFWQYWRFFYLFQNVRWTFISVLGNISVTVLLHAFRLGCGISSCLKELSDYCSL